MQKLDTKGVQNIIFNIFCEFAEFCEKENLRYSMCGGTLLGAVRHKGFIPWDDDIDVVMPRPDYNRLCDLAKSSCFSKKYKFVSFRNNNSNWAGARLMDLTTLNKTKYLELEPHLFMDIFPVDGLPKNKNRSDEILIKAKRIKKMVELSSSRIGTGKGKIKKYVKIPFSIAAKIYTPHYYSSKLDSLAQRLKFDDCDYVGAVASSCGVCERLKKSDFLDTELLVFNGRLFQAMSCWDIYLKGMYGDYMKIPKQKDRENHFIKAYAF